MNPYREGTAAYDRGESESANPYQRGTGEWRAWGKGWNDAKTKDLRRK